MIGVLKENGVPALADSRCVLFDHWDEEWPAWVDVCLQWLIDEGYPPGMAHPERLLGDDRFDQIIESVTSAGARLQGNF